MPTPLIVTMSVALPTNWRKVFHLDGRGEGGGTEAWHTNDYSETRKSSKR